MIAIRAGNARGPTDLGWLKSQHAFSFGHYYDPNHMGYGPLRVINEDRVAPGAGFGTHPHDNMEIVSYVLAGALAHKDSMGTGSVIKPGEIQRMSAGTGVTHSEYNHSKEHDVHFLQIWFLPEQQNIAPSYEQKGFPDQDKMGKFRLVLSRDGREGSVTIHQDVAMYSALLDGQSAVFMPEKDRLQWVQVVRGQVVLNGQPLKAGDGAAIKDEKVIDLNQGVNAEIILFDMVA